LRKSVKAGKKLGGGDKKIHSASIISQEFKMQRP
jgi:hypothetical protein